MSGKSGFGARMSRRLTRIRERFLQKFGKSGKTIDEAFDECLSKFSEHHSKVSRYEKTVKNYYSAMKKMRSANQQLMDAIWDVYDPSWVESDKVQLKVGVLEQNYDTFIKQFKSKVLYPLHRYVGRMNEISSRISKREERRLDYDASRRNLEKVQASEKQDPDKLERVEREFGETQSMYEDINEELIEELPQFNDARVYFLGLILNSFSEEEHRFHSEAAILYGHLLEHTKVLNRSVIDDSLMDYINKEERRSLSGLSALSGSSSSKASTSDVSDAENPAGTSTGGQDEYEVPLDAQNDSS